MTFFYDLNKRLNAITGKKSLNESRLPAEHEPSSDLVPIELPSEEAAETVAELYAHVVTYDDHDNMLVPREYLPEIQELIDELEESAYPGVTPEHLDEALAAGDKIKFRKNGKVMSGEVVRFDKGRNGESAAYVVYVPGHHESFFVLPDDIVHGQLDELSPDTLKSYAKKAADDTWVQGRKYADAKASGDREGMRAANRRDWNHHKGIDRAMDRLEEEQLDELSPDTLKSYIKKAHRDQFNRGADIAHRSRGDDFSGMIDATKKELKRKTGIDRAVDRLEEATVQTKGDVKVIRQGNEFYIVLHPEHIEAISSLSDGGRTVIRDETGTQYAVTKMGDELNFKNPRAGVDVTVDCDEICDSQINELGKKTLGQYIKKASNDRGWKGFEAGVSDSGSSEQKKAANKMARRQQGVERATDRLALGYPGKHDDWTKPNYSNKLEEDADMEDLISGLRKAYAGIDRVDPSSPVYKKLIAFLDGLDAEHLRVLANAGVKFVSMLAKSRLMRKGFDECSMNERAGPVSSGAGGGTWQSHMHESKKAKKDYDGDGKIESPKDEVMGSRMKAAKKAGKLKEAEKPDYIDIDKDGNKSEPMRKAIKDKEQVDEISHDTARNYLAKSRREEGGFKTYDAKSKPTSNRDVGAQRAIKRLSKTNLEESDSGSKEAAKAYAFDQIMRALKKSGKTDDELMASVGFCRGCIKGWLKEGKKGGTHGKH